MIIEGSGMDNDFDALLQQLQEHIFEEYESKISSEKKRTKKNKK